MSAINPARLKTQTAELGEIVDQPIQFAVQLHELLGYYSARIRQTNLSRTPLKLQTYQVPDPVIQALEIEISERLEEDPEAGFHLVDTLWVESWLEFRQIAVHVLGILPPHEPDRILSRIQNWINTCSSDDIRRLVMIEGMTRLARERTDDCLIFIKELVSSGLKDNHQAALFGLELFAMDPSYLNLPVIFRNFSKILLVEESGLTKEINMLLRILAARSEQETTYFLVKQLDAAYKPRIVRVVRQVMNHLSEDNQNILREKIGPAKS